MPGYYGSPFDSGCHPECTISSDCSRDKACVNNKCVDPCPGVCGYSSICHTVNHSPICSCPPQTVGDPFVECKQAPSEPIDPCNPSPCNQNGFCRVINGAAICTYPECTTNDECSYDRACFNQKCSDPCVNACGLNAVCNAINHKPICVCPPGYVGSPYVQCSVQRDEPVPKPECERDSDCTNDKACINQQCRNPCNERNVCSAQALCHAQMHRPICVCPDGYTGNAQFSCYEVGCRSDSDCPATQACINRNCVDTCQQIQCGQNAYCRSDYGHQGRCYCLDGYRGNPLIKCDRPECTQNSDCSYRQVCSNEKCIDPCNCGIGAQCRIDNHRATCVCPPGYTGDAYNSCNRSKCQSYKHFFK